MHSEPIIVKELGKIWGRDAIFLDKIEFERTHSVKLIGEFNGALCENVKDQEYVPYELTFSGILQFKMTELDLYTQSEYTSSFEKVIDSLTLKAFALSADNAKVEPSHRHYMFYTYDDVIEVIASDFELNLDLKKEWRTIKPNGKEKRILT